MPRGSGRNVERRIDATCRTGSNARARLRRAIAKQISATVNRPRSFPRHRPRAQARSREARNSGTQAGQGVTRGLGGGAARKVTANHRFLLKLHLGTCSSSYAMPAAAACLAASSASSPRSLGCHAAPGCIPLRTTESSCGLARRLTQGFTRRALRAHRVDPSCGTRRGARRLGPPGDCRGPWGSRCRPRVTVRGGRDPGPRACRGTPLAAWWWTCVES